MAEGDCDSVPGHRAGPCRHDGFHSGVGLYLHDAQLLRYVLICDDCGTEIKEISAVEYVPRPALS
jgi:hypothetical protein